MLFSYYDTYYSDLFISERNEGPITITTKSIFNSGSGFNSPGVNDTRANSPSLNDLKAEVAKELGLPQEAESSSYENSKAFKELLDRRLGKIVVTEIDRNSLIGILFSCALNHGDRKTHFSLESYRTETYDEVLDENEYLNEISVNYKLRCNILNGYTESITSLSKNCTLITSKINSSISTKEAEQERIKKEIISLLKKGLPVIVGGQNYGDENHDGHYQNGEPLYGHVCVAYDYDEQTNTIYGNRGWGPNYTYYSLNDYFNKQFSDYYALNISSNLPKTYTEHYYFTDIKRYYSPTNNIFITKALSPSEYGFADNYPTDSTTKTSFLTNTFSNGITLKTKRYRTGYIHNEFIVMSCIRSGINEAFIEYQFEQPICGLIVTLSHWREASHDWLTKNNESAYLSVFGHQDPRNPYDQGGWIRQFDLLSDETNLSRNRMAPSKFIINFNQTITRIKFQCHSSITTSSESNRGRICIGDRKLITKEEL